MFDVSSSPRSLFLQLIGWGLLAAGIVLAIMDDAFGWFVAAALIGGAVSAATFLLISRRTHDAPLTQPDAFGPGGMGSDVINVSHIRVAGVGGLGLVVMAVVVAIAVPAIGVSLAFGLVGGFVLSLLLIVYRRRRAGRWS